MSKLQNKIADMCAQLAKLGINQEDALKLRRIEMTLHRWHERECGDGYGCIERDEAAGKPYWLNSRTMRRYRIPDLEAGARASGYSSS